MDEKPFKVKNIGTWFYTLQLVKSAQISFYRTCSYNIGPLTVHLTISSLQIQGTSLVNTYTSCSNSFALLHVCMTAGFRRETAHCSSRYVHVAYSLTRISIDPHIGPGKETLLFILVDVFGEPAVGNTSYPEQSYTYSLVHLHLTFIISFPVTFPPPLVCPSPYQPWVKLSNRFSCLCVFVCALPTDLPIGTSIGTPKPSRAHLGSTASAVSGGGYSGYRESTSHVRSASGSVSDAGGLTPASLQAYHFEGGNSTADYDVATGRWETYDHVSSIIFIIMNIFH